MGTWWKFPFPSLSERFGDPGELYPFLKIPIVFLFQHPEYNKCRNYEEQDTVIWAQGYYCLLRKYGTEAGLTLRASSRALN